MATTDKGAPYPVANVDSVDGAAQIQALAEWTGSHLPAEMTSAARDALTGAALWAGRTIWNSTTGRRERYSGTAWVSEVPAVTKTVRIPHTWAISGDVKVASGDSDYILPFFVPMPSGQTVRVVSAKYRINGGSSATVTLNRWSNAGSVTAIQTGISVASSLGVSNLGDDVTLEDGAALALVVTAVSGSPRNMTFTVFLDYEV